MADSTRHIRLPLVPSLYYDPFDLSTHNLEYASKVSGVNFVRTARTRPSISDASCLPSRNVKSPKNLLGLLTATSDSIFPHLVIDLDRRKTSWGRNPQNTVVHHSEDIRIPRTAFTIIWYLSSGERIRHGKDWRGHPNLRAGICTNATSGIMINGKHVKKRDGNGRIPFIGLHNGDKIRVYRDGRRHLDFECKLFYGCGSKVRDMGVSGRVHEDLLDARRSATDGNRRIERLKE